MESVKSPRPSDDNLTYVMHPGDQQHGVQSRSRLPPCHTWMLPVMENRAVIDRELRVASSPEHFVNLGQVHFLATDFAARKLL